MSRCILPLVLRICHGATLSSPYYSLVFLRLLMIESVCCHRALLHTSSKVRLYICEHVWSSILKLYRSMIYIVSCQPSTLSIV